MPESMLIEDPGGNGMPLDEVWAWVVVHGPTEESIMGVNGLPLVMQQEILARSMRFMVERAVAATGKSARLIRLVRAEVCDEVDP